jgi:hypothetical protein
MTPGSLKPGWLPDSLGRTPGAFLLSARGRTAEDWAVRRGEVGEMVWGSLYQQHPTPPEGAIFAYEHIERNRRPADWTTDRARTAVAVDTSAGGEDEAGIIGGYRGTDSRVYVTADRSGRMTEVAWARAAWLLVLDLAADDLVWEQNLAPGTMRRTLEAAWQRIVQQVRTLEEAEKALTDPFTGRRLPPALGQATDLDRMLVETAALRWAATEQRIPIEEARPTAEEIAQLTEVLTRMRAGQFDGILGSLPARLIAVTASQGKRTRATPVATAYETNRVSHVGTLPELEQELTQWQEGMPSPGRLDADVWLVTHLSGARRGRTSSSAATTLPSVTPDSCPEVPGVSSRRPHEPESLTLEVSRMDGGGLILRCPLAPGWAVPARTPAELATRMEQAWQEAAIAAYARLRGVLYDLAETEETIPPEAFPATGPSTRRSPRTRSRPAAGAASGTRPRTSRSSGWSWRTGAGSPRPAAGTGRRRGRSGRSSPPSDAGPGELRHGAP